jgi:hypothetical protein
MLLTVLILALLRSDPAASRAEKSCRFGLSATGRAASHNELSEDY